MTLILVVQVADELSRVSVGPVEGINLFEVSLPNISQSVLMVKCLPIRVGIGRVYQHRVRNTHLRSDQLGRSPFPCRPRLRSACRFGAGLRSAIPAWVWFHADHS
jgi:hypothetical protein